MSDDLKPGRRPVARHGQLTSPPLYRQILAMMLVAVAVVIASVAGVAAFAVWDTANAIADNAVDIDEGELPPTIGEIEGGTNILLVGTDSCEGQDLTLFPRCANNDAEGERNDVTMLVNISDNPRRVTVVSFPRDMLVPIPSCPAEDGGSYSAMSEQPLNASYSYGGLACSVLTIEELTGVDVQFAASIRWMGVIAMSDAVGGVDVCVAGQIDDVHTGLHLTPGQHTLKGAEALQFLRIRHGIGDGSDLGRISNQQQFMSSLVRKLQGESTLSDPGKLFGFATAAMTQVQNGQLLLTSSLANPTLMVQIAMALNDVPYEDFVFVQYPTTYSADFLRVYPVRGSADVLFAAIAENRPLQITGGTSGGNGTEVTGEAEQPDAGATPEPTESAGPDAPAEETPSEEAVALPGDITGQTPAQITCTVPEG